MQCYFPIEHSTEGVSFYSIFLRLTSRHGTQVRLRAFTNCTENPLDGEGIELIPTFFDGRDELVNCPYCGFLQFQVPETAWISKNRGFCLVIEPVVADTIVSCDIYALMLNGQFSGVQYLQIDSVHLKKGNTELLLEEFSRSFFPFFFIDSISTVEVDCLKGGNEAFFSLPDVGENEYVLLYKRPDKTDIYNKTACEIFIAKNHYLPNEPITVSYRNLYAKFNIHTTTVDLMFYLDGDRPGIDRSRDYVTLMFKEYCRGLSGAVTLPDDGARNYRTYIKGNYRLHLMHRYVDLCPPLQYTVSDARERTELNAPPAGTLFFIKASSLPSQLEVQTVHPERLMVWRFTCASPTVRALEQQLYRMQDVNDNLDVLGECGSVTDNMREAIVMQILQTAYAGKKIELARYTKREIPDDFCRKIILFIDENLCNNINLKMLMEEFHSSESFLSHYFKKQMKISISSYIYQAKIARSKQWLLEGSKTISEIAELLNYSDVHSFSHAFKHMEGMSPSEFRQLRRIAPPEK